MQGFLVLASAAPPPSWSEYLAVHGAPDWSAAAELSDDVWVYDGRQLLSASDPGSATRGEVLPRRGGPRTVLDALAWPRARSDLDSVQLIAFPVKPA